MFDATDRWLAGGAAVVSLLVLLIYEPWRQPAQGDIALFQLFGRLIAEGQVPYADFFDHKTPLAYYLNAFVSLLAGWFNFDYIMGARGLSIALFALASAGMYALARYAGLARLSAFVASLLFLAVDLFAWSAALGFESKALVSIVGIGALLAAYRGKWAVSGLLCGLAVLAWQPGVVFLAGALTQAALNDRSQLGRRAGVLVLAFFAPIVGLLLYLIAVGAMDEFWADTVRFNREYVGSPPWPPLERASHIVNQSYSSDRWLLLVGSLAFGCWLVAALLRVRTSTRVFAPQLPIATVTLGVAAYSVVNFGGIGDIFPFVPWVAFWAAWLIDAIVRVSPRYGLVLGALASLLLLGYGQHTLIDQTTLQDPNPTLSFQRAQVRAIEDSALVSEDDPLYVTNLAWFVLLAGRENLTKYNFHWSGVPRFVADETGGSDELYRAIIQRKPKLVVLGFGADSHVVQATEHNYQRIDPGSLPSYFSNRAQYWIRDDLPAAGATADLLLREADLRAFCDEAIDWRSARAEAGNLVSVIGSVVSVRKGRTGSTALELGEPGKFSVLLTPRAVATLGEPPERLYAGKVVCARGVVRPILGVLSITVDDPSLVLTLE